VSGSISLCRRDRKALLALYRQARDPQVRLRAHILLLLDAGYSRALIAAALFTSASTINRWRQRFLDGGLEAVGGPRRPRASAWSAWWVALVIQWVTLRSPTDFGFVRSRWTCATVALLLREDHGVRVSRETVRRWLRRADLVWRRPRPVVGPEDPRRAQKLRRIRAVLRDLPADETAVFQDETDVNTNPEVGCMWMSRGQQAEVVTPGTNVKRYLAGSLHWRTGGLILSAPGTRRNADLFLAHLDELRRRFRRYKVSHVICDNAAFHSPERCRKVREYLKRWGHRLRLHFLPTYAPEANPIERVWWHLRDEITRNHRCKDIDELLDLIFDWLAAGSRFGIEISLYDSAKATKATAA
jgi:putative transposase